MNPLSNAALPITSIRFLLDGHEFLKFGADDALEVERPLPFTMPGNPDFAELALAEMERQSVYFFRANGKTIAVARKYHCYLSDRHKDEMVIELSSDDLIR